MVKCRKCNSMLYNCTENTFRDYYQPVQFCKKTLSISHPLPSEIDLKCCQAGRCIYKSQFKLVFQHMSLVCQNL